jgi:ribose 5-phosphate isomerase
MEKTVLIVLIGNRKEAAVTIQKILTDWGCTIKTRLGIHDGVLDNCTNSGLLILDIVGQKEKNEEMTRKINLIHGVKAQLVTLSID